MARFRQKRRFGMKARVRSLDRLSGELSPRQFQSTDLLMFLIAPSVVQSLKMNSVSPSRLS